MVRAATQLQALFDELNYLSLRARVAEKHAIVSTLEGDVIQNHYQELAMYRERPEVTDHDLTVAISPLPRPGAARPAVRLPSRERGWPRLSPLSAAPGQDERL